MFLGSQELPLELDTLAGYTAAPDHPAPTSLIHGVAMYSVSQQGLCVGDVINGKIYTKRKKCIKTAIFLYKLIFQLSAIPGIMFYVMKSLTL